jgi:hypothetical protein
MDQRHRLADTTPSLILACSWWLLALSLGRFMAWS